MNVYEEGVRRGVVNCGSFPSKLSPPFLNRLLKPAIHVADFVQLCQTFSREPVGNQSGGHSQRQLVQIVAVIKLYCETDTAHMLSYTPPGASLLELISLHKPDTLK